MKGRQLSRNCGRKRGFLNEGKVDIENVKVDIQDEKVDIESVLSEKAVISQ